MTDKWGGSKVTKLRRYFATMLPTPCGECGRVIELTDSWVIGHVHPRVTHPHLVWELSNMRLEHRRCSDGTGTSVNQRAAERRGFEAGYEAGFSDGHLAARLEAQQVAGLAGGAP